MSIPATNQNLPGPIDQPCLVPTQGNPWKKFKEDLQGLQKRIDPKLDAQAREMDLNNFANRMVGHTEKLSDKHAELGLLGKQVVELERFAKSINDQSSEEVDKTISVSLSIADKVFRRTKRDINKIGKLTDNVKRDKMVAIALKDLDAGMLDVTAPILSLPRCNVFRETVIRCSLPRFDNMKIILSTKLRKAHESANQKHQTKAGYSCVVA
ncbi:hypothetical protein KCU78_g3596, partial [Aureobasidium melanogenum]